VITYKAPKRILKSSWLIFFNKKMGNPSKAIPSEKRIKQENNIEC
jgi:hypothetical protein